MSNPQDFPIRTTEYFKRIRMSYHLDRRIEVEEWLRQRGLKITSEAGSFGGDGGTMIHITAECSQGDVDGEMVNLERKTREAVASFRATKLGLLSLLAVALADLESVDPHDDGCAICGAPILWSGDPIPTKTIDHRPECSIRLIRGALDVHTPGWDAQPSSPTSGDQS